MVATLFCSERTERFNCKLVVDGERIDEWRDVKSLIFGEGIDMVDVDSAAKTVIAVADRIVCEKGGDVLKCSEVKAKPKTEVKPKTERRYPEWVKRVYG